VEAMLAAGIPAELSLSAGSFLCNQVFYELMHHLAIHNDPLPAGFIHLPMLPEQAASQSAAIPSMSLGTMLQGMRIALDVIASAKGMH
jgi:pyroglutamyl-peptidase